MSGITIQRALISVYDKRGVAAFSRRLRDAGIEIISSGGTATYLAQEGITVTTVESVTSAPELLDGRVKTLHPAIHAAILADRTNTDHIKQLQAHGITPIDLVVVNLYPFSKTVASVDCRFEEAIEMIDIGGPCLLRAAAKNHRSVVVVCDPAQYDGVAESLEGQVCRLDEPQRLEMARQVFELTRSYDDDIVHYFRQVGALTDSNQPPAVLELPAYQLIRQLRYGENPHQPAAAYAARPQVGRGPSLLYHEPLGDTQMSFNNYVDANAALTLCTELAAERREPGVAVFVKHTNPCGVGVAETISEAYRRAYLGDPLAAMGGILAVNVEVDQPFAAAVMDSLDRWGKAAGAGAFFVEVWVAPGFSADAQKAIRTLRKWGPRVRLLPVASQPAGRSDPGAEIKTIAGGLLVQQSDLKGIVQQEWTVASDRQPNERESADLKLAWLICKHTKSNAITICRDGMLLGNGAGQMSRVMSCRVATWLARESGHDKRLTGAAAASDAFFPFADGPQLLMDAGVTAIIQPGGSKRDEQTIDACNARGVALVMTATRHFKH